MLFGEINPSKKYRIRGETLLWIIRQCKKVAGMRGDGVRNTPETITVAWPPRGRGGGGAADPWRLLRVDSASVGGGIYLGREIILASETISLGIDLTEAIIGTASDTDVLILNTPEVGQATHDLTNEEQRSKYFWGRRHPASSAAGHAVYVINGIDLKDCDS